MRTTTRPRRTTCAWIALALAACSPPTQPERPSILLVVSDTLRADALGSYGGPAAPALDALAERSALFERAWAQSPWTLPSFGSILTGTYPTTHGAVRLEPERYDPLDPTLPTLPELLAEAGYRTAAFLTNPHLREEFGLARGFERYDFHETEYRHTKRGEKVRAPQIVDAALGWLADEAPEDAPLFCMVHVFDPHVFYDPPEPFAPPALAEGDRRTLVNDLHKRLWSGPDALLDGDRELARALYAGEVAAMDQALGRLFDTVAADERDWVVVFTSDHGEEFWEHGGWEHGHSLHDEVLRVPLLIAGADVPGLAPGRRTDEVSHVDIAPTLLELAGVPAPESWPGASLTRPRPGRAILCESMLYGPEKHAVVQDGFKLVRRKTAPRRALFDLTSDPAETRDLAREDPARVQALAAQLTHLRGEARAQRPEREASPLELDPETLRALKAVGY